MSKHVFVTGASGFIGSHLCRKLVERGDRVRALARRSSNLAALKDLDVEIVYGDLTDGGLPDGALQGVETVYNVAAVYRTEGVPEHYFYDVNAHGTERLLQAAAQADVSRFVHCSTVGVHGNISNPPADEMAPYGPGDVYQRSKLEGELRARAFGREHGLPVAVVRPTAIYGPGDTRFLKLFRSINKGTFWMIGSGTTFYHLVYVEDLANGFILAGECPEAIGEVFIVGGDGYVTIKQLVSMIAEVLDRPLPQRHVPVRPVMLAARLCQKVCRPLRIEPPLYPRRLDFFIKHRAFDTAKAKRMLGYQPTVDLKTGLARTAAWYKNNGYL